MSSSLLTAPPSSVPHHPSFTMDSVPAELYDTILKQLDNQSLLQVLSVSKYLRRITSLILIREYLHPSALVFENSNKPRWIKLTADANRYSFVALSLLPDLSGDLPVFLDVEINENDYFHGVCTYYNKQVSRIDDQRGQIGFVCRAPNWDARVANAVESAGRAGTTWIRTFTLNTPVHIALSDITQYSWYSVWDLWLCGRGFNHESLLTWMEGVVRQQCLEQLHIHDSDPLQQSNSHAHRSPWPRLLAAMDLPLLVGLDIEGRMRVVDLVTCLNRHPGIAELRIGPLSRLLKCWNMHDSIPWIIPRIYGSDLCPSSLFHFKSRGTIHEVGLTVAKQSPVVDYNKPQPWNPSSVRRILNVFQGTLTCIRFVVHIDGYKHALPQLCRIVYGVYQDAGNTVPFYNIREVFFLFTRNGVPIPCTDDELDDIHNIKLWFPSNTKFGVYGEIEVEGPRWTPERIEGMMQIEPLLEQAMLLYGVDIEDLPPA